MADASYQRDTASPNDVDVLRADLAALRQDLSALGHHFGDAARSRFAQVRMSSMDMAKSARERAVLARDQVGGHIGHHPFMSVGLAFGVGVILGAVVARR